MDIEQALLAAIESDPSDETNWSVLADWNEEQGRLAQAELIRLSVQLRRGNTPSKRTKLEQRLQELVWEKNTLLLPRKRVPLDGAIDLEVLQIPPGTFLMGSPASENRRDDDEGPVHPVTLTRPFWLGVYPVTQAQWEAVMRSRAPGRFRGANRPVEGISWEMASEFLSTLTKLVDLPFRLPSEAQWEYACRGLTSTPFSYGKSLSGLAANFDGNFPYGSAPTGPWLHHTSPVGSYLPNAFGLYDMHGNVWEWCNDWYDESYYARSPVLDPIGPATGILKVLRGGSWYSYSWTCRSAGRERFTPESGAGNYGLRVCLQPD